MNAEGRRSMLHHDTPEVVGASESEVGSSLFREPIRLDCCVIVAAAWRTHCSVTMHRRFYLRPRRWGSNDV